MADMLDYLAWRGDIEFTQMPVNPVDALIFSTLSYIQFEDIVPDNPIQSISLKEAAKGLLSLAEPQNRVRVKKDLELLSVTGSSRNGAVQITISGDMSVVKNVHVAENMSAADMEIAIGEAVADVINNAKMESAKRLSEVTGGIDLSSMGL